MKNYLKRALSGLFMAGASVLFLAAQEAAPIITFHTNLYDLAGSANVFTLRMGARETTYLDIDCGFGPMETEVSPALWDDETGSVQPTYITCTVGPEGDVKIYGDPSLIDYIDFEGVYISSIEWPAMTDVEILNLQHNQLEGLDISHMKKLQACYLSDNPGTQATPIIVGKDKPDLMILETAMITWLDPDFDIDTYPELRSLVSYSTPSLTKLTPSGCPTLIQLSADATNLSGLDITKNPHLQILNVSETRISSLDLSGNALLTELYISNDGGNNTDSAFTELDLSPTPRLRRLFCAGNHLTSLDLSVCPQLQSLFASRNRLTSLNIDGCSEIFEMSIDRNYLNFNTCPLPSPNYSTYYYEQYPTQVARSYKAGDILDLTQAVIRPGSDTDCVMFTFNRTNPGSVSILDPEAYTYSEGKITLNQALPDSVYAAFVCNDFPEWMLTTTPFMVKEESEFGKPSVAVTLQTSLTARQQDYRVGLRGASAENPVEFFVDFGDGDLVPFTSTSETLPAQANASGARKGATTTFWLPENVDMTAFGVSGIRLTSINLNSAPALRDLEVMDCHLPEIDLTLNKNLNRLNLAGNQLVTLNLKPDVMELEKLNLHEIDASRNLLESVVNVELNYVTSINLADNRLADYDLTHAYNLKTLDLSDNQLSELRISDCEKLEECDLSSNRLSQLMIPYDAPMDRLDISRNCFTFENLPSPDCSSDFTYAPQREILIPSKAPSINLSAQYVEIDGHQTQYEWRFAADDSAVDMNQMAGENGKFRFTNPDLGLIYCAMTNGAYPQFEGVNVLKTTAVQTAPPPTNRFLSFTTEEDASVGLSIAATVNNREIYIDWSGEGFYEQYLLADSYRLFSAEAKAGIEVGCYSYEENDDVKVFSMGGSRLRNVDASNMKSVLLLGLSQAGLSESSDIKWPSTPTFTELRLDGNEFETMDFSNFSSLNFISMNNNKLKRVDLSPMKNLQVAYFANNAIEEVVADNPRLWEISFDNNELTSFTLDKLPAAEQLWIAMNNLETIDISGAAMLKVLSLSFNRLTFATLPLPSNTFNRYIYQDQQPVAVEVKDGYIVDLSDQSNVDSSETTYRWFIGTPFFDENNELVGEELVEGTEYETENGVTTFFTELQNVMCVMTNPVFPNLYLYTDFIDVAGSGIAEIGSPEVAAQWYDLQGRRIAKPTQPGLYIRNEGGKSRKVMVR